MTVLTPNYKPITYFGGPGTAKTGTLLHIIQDLISSGISPERIAFVSYTRAALREMKDRLVLSFPNLDQKESFKYFRTLHSLAYHQLSLKDQLFDGECLADFGKQFQYHFQKLVYTKTDDDPEAMFAQTTSLADHGRLFNCYCQQLRTKEPNEIVLQNEIKAIRDLYPTFKQRIEEYQEQNDAYTYEKWLELLINSKNFPHVDYLFVDEAQDCNTLQWQVIDTWVETIGILDDHIILAADDDQALFGYSGAKAQLLLSRAQNGKKIILKRSYRLSKKVLALHLELVERIKEREPKNLFSLKEEGEIYRINPSSLPLQLKNKLNQSWFILARDGFVLEKFEQEILEPSGIPYKQRGPKKSPLALKEATLYYMLKTGGPYHAKWIKELIKRKGYFKRGAKTKIDNYIKEKRHEWKDDPFKKSATPLLTVEELKNFGISEEFEKELLNHNPYIIKCDPLTLSYYDRVWRNYGEDVFLHPPSIILSTIHRVKGREADNVVLLADCSRASYLNFKNANTKDEAIRVITVAISRTKNNLYIASKPFCSSNSILDFFPEFDKYGYT